MKTKAIIFDMGGVLIDLDIKACRQAFIDDLGFVGIDEILDPCHQKGILGDMESGKASAEEFREYILAGSAPGHEPEDVDRALWKILLDIAPEKVALLKRLSQKYDIYMLSNNNPVCLPKSAEIFEQADFDMYENFRKCYISCQMKMMKPDPEFYRAVIEDIGLPAEEILFVDDSQRNIDAAIAVGLPSVCYKPGSDLGKLLAKTLNDFSFLSEEVQG